MLAEALISFRESLEAALVVGIVLAYLGRTGNERYNGYIYAGTGAGILASILGGFLLSSVGAGFEGAAAKFFEGAMMVVGSVLVSWMILWMLRQSRVRQEIEARVGQELNNKHALGLLLFVFVSVLREGIETVIFLYASFFSSQAFSWTGVLLGFGVAVLFSLFIFEAAMRVDLRLFFNATSLLLVFFAAGLFSHAVGEFQEAGILPEQGPLWDTSWLVSENSLAGAVLKSLFGYSPDPTPMRVVAYVFYWVAVGVAYANLDRLKGID